MRKIIVCLAESFDSRIEGPNGELDWIVFGSDGASDLMSFIGEIDTVLYGRVSYEMWGDPEITDESSEFEKQFSSCCYSEGCQETIFLARAEYRFQELEESMERCQSICRNEQGDWRTQANR